VVYLYISYDSQIKLDYFSKGNRSVCHEDAFCFLWRGESVTIIYMNSGPQGISNTRINLQPMLSQQNILLIGCSRVWKNLETFLKSRRMFLDRFRIFRKMCSSTKVVKRKVHHLVNSIKTTVMHWALKAITAMNTYYRVTWTVTDFLPIWDATDLLFLSLLSLAFCRFKHSLICSPLEPVLSWCLFEPLW
jgi:hypothetical protein